LRLFTFPVKYHWKEQANLALIVQSAHQLVSLVDCSPLTVGTKLEHVYLPRPGCGNGGLMWSVVIHFIQPILDDRFTVVEINGA
jgi:hypothetical protein